MNALQRITRAIHRHTGLTLNKDEVLELKPVLEDITRHVAALKVAVDALKKLSEPMGDAYASEEEMNQCQTASEALQRIEELQKP